MIRHDGKVLLSWNKNLQTWIPVGGHIDPGETPQEAVCREVAEETGFEFEFYQKSVFENNGKVEIIKPHRIQIEEVPHHNKHINFVFFGKCTKYTDKAATDEKEKLKWFSREEIVSMKDTMIESVYTLSLEAIKSIQDS